MATKKATVLNEGKTKIIYEKQDDETAVIVASKDAITAGDGAKHDVYKGKAELATITACNVFRLLNESGVKTAFREQISPTEFVADKCDMIDLEVVVRREGHGSHLKRNPHHKKGCLFPRLRVEFYLKTTNKEWDKHTLPTDDPLIEFIQDKDGVIDAMNLYRPDKPIATQKPFLNVKGFPFEWDQKLLDKMKERATFIFLILERAWFLEGSRLVDFKIEFGFNSVRKLVLSDVIDNDSWRLVQNGQYRDKQVYRDGGEQDEVMEKFAGVAEATNNFRLPRQRILLWSGSPDDLDPNDERSSWNEFFTDFMHPIDCELKYHVCSAHKQPTQAFNTLQRWAHGRTEDACTNMVIIAYIGMSNGAGPTLSANTHVPVITCSPSVDDFPDDIWSSLRTPSNVPVTTVLGPKNALLAAINILAGNSPRLYAIVRQKIEARMDPEVVC